MKIEVPYSVPEFLNCKLLTENDEPTTRSIRASYDDVEQFQGPPSVEGEPVSLSTLTYTRLNPLSNKIDCSFFKRAMKKQPSFDKIEFFQIAPNPDNKYTTSTVTDKAFVAVKECMAFIEVKVPVVQQNKESLSTLFDLVDDCGCEVIFACIEKDFSESKRIIQSYLSLGFNLCNSIILPGYILLSQEL